MRVAHHNGKDYVLFWGGIFSNWHLRDFYVGQVKYNCSEQYMMHEKALAFGDFEIAAKIMQEKAPKKQKELGWQVKNFDKQKWDAVKYEIVKTGIREKFREFHMYSQFIRYYGCQFVEASPEDRIWGVGYGEENALENTENWGENLLGKILTELCTEYYNIANSWKQNQPA